METKKTKEDSSPVKPSVDWKEKIIIGIKAIAFLSAMFELIKEIYKFFKDIGWV